MKKFYHTFICLILTSLIYCDEAGPSLASTEGLVNSMVEGCVSAVTGDFVHQEVDLVIPGLYPLALKHTYSGCNSFHGQIYCGWQLSDPSRMTVQQEVSSYQRNLMASLTTAHGAQAKY